MNIKKVSILFIISVIFLSLSLHKTLNNMEHDCNKQIDSLANLKIRNTLKYRFFLTEIIKNAGLTEEKYLQLSQDQQNKLIKQNALELCLDGKKYQAIDRLGGGAEGDVYEIQDSTDKKFALKVYMDKRDQQGDLLAKEKAQKSKEYLSLPILVNMNYKYSILPDLEHTYSHVKSTRDPAGKKLLEFQNNLNAALRLDGLKIGDNENESNYMFDENNKLWRVDFTSLKEINKVST